MDEQGSLDNRCSISLRFDGATESVSLCHNAQANAGRSDTQVSQSPPQYLALHHFFETSYFLQYVLLNVCFVFMEEVETWHLEQSKNYGSTNGMTNGTTNSIAAGAFSAKAKSSKCRSFRKDCCVGGRLKRRSVWHSQMIPALVDSYVISLWYCCEPRLTFSWNHLMLYPRWDGEVSVYYTLGSWCGSCLGSHVCFSCILLLELHGVQV